jgi:hypothetical protein
VKLKLGVLLILLMLLFAPSSSAKGKNSLKKYRSSNLGFRFSYPSTYILASCGGSHDPHSCVGLRAHPKEKDATVYVSLLPMRLEPALRERGGFEKVGGKWIAHGRGADSPAVKIKGPGWRGLYAITVCGISDELGFHAAGGECLTAMLNRGGRTFIVETDGTVPLSLILNTIIKTFRMN